MSKSKERREYHRYIPYNELAYPEIYFEGFVTSARVRDISTKAAYVEYTGVRYRQLQEPVVLNFTKDMICVPLKGKIIRINWAKPGVDSGFVVEFDSAFIAAASYVVNWVKEDSISYVKNRLIKEFFGVPGFAPDVL